MESKIIFLNRTLNTDISHKCRYAGATALFILTMVTSMIFSSCNETVEHTAPAINPQDSVAVMSSYGVNTLVSDSGVMKYRIVAEEWIVNQNLNPSRWIFEKGLFIEQFDEKFHIEAYIQCDTAYYYDIKKLWELRSHVRLRTKDGKIFSSEQLFWDQQNHELYSNCFSKISMPDKELQGDYFRSNERFTKYNISNSKGSMDKDRLDSGQQPATTEEDKADTVVVEKREPVRPKAKLK